MKRRATWLTALALLPIAAAAAAEALPDGRALYNGYARFEAGRDATASRLPPSFAACAGCHGMLAGGGGEGGVKAPAIGWAMLTAARSGAPAYAGAAEMRRAIAAGVGRSGRALDAAMPRFRLTDAEADALLDYLRRAGTPEDQPRGVDAATIVLGTVLPLSAASPAGRSVAAGLRDVFDAHPPIYGRRIVLAIEDSVQGGPADALRRLLARPVYALVAGILGSGAEPGRLLAEAHVAHLAGLSVRPHARDIGPWELDLLAPADRQDEALGAAMQRCDGPRLALSGGGDPGSEAVRWFADAAALGREAARLPAGCAGFGLAGLAVVGHVLPAGWRRRMVLPIPRVMLAPAVDGGPADPWRGLGRSAARLAVSLLARSGAVLHERSPLVAAVAMRSEPLDPGPAAQFSARRRYAWDAEVIALDPVEESPARADTSGRQTP